MPETDYRASRIFRVLGNPTAYRVLKSLDPEKKRTPSKIAKELELSISAVSRSLRSLRLVDLVRYQTRGPFTDYWIKDPAVVKLLSATECLVEKNRSRRT